MRSPEPRILAYAPGDLEGARLVAAASRSGALGIFCPGRTVGSNVLISSLHRHARRTRRPFGLRLHYSDLFEMRLANLPHSLDVLILMEEPGVDWRSAFHLISATGRKAWAEVRSKEAALDAENAGFVGLIAAGHEAGGFVSEESSFILLQGILDRVKAPVWVRGGIGPNVAAGCLAAGAAGVVLDGALLLARESPLATETREWIARSDGSETIVLGPVTGPRIRVHGPPRPSVVARLRDASQGEIQDWSMAVSAEVGWGKEQAWPVGQDAALASEMAGRYGTAGGIIQAIERSIDKGLAEARASRPLAESSPMANSLGTRYPILQGPMTRVSDVAEFASAIADGGALPFLALAMLSRPEVSDLLRRAAELLGTRPYGVGVLGFISPELRAEQVAAILEAKPPFALIAGGRPDQARELEEAGIATFLHAPSPGLLGQFLRDGGRRFVLEGRECGGHVGPRSSFLLWEQAIEVILDAIDKGIVPGEIQVAFAGGIHDARSAALVSAMAAPLASRGVRVGVLIGTAYLFTREAVSTGAIVGQFQDEAIRCRETVLLETGPGHEVRVSPSPFVANFELERRRLVSEGASADAIGESLERLSAGRLRVATKGIERQGGVDSPLFEVAPVDQYDRGIYMFGQVATLRDRVTTIAALHRSIAESSSDTLDRLDLQAVETVASPSDVAIVGMSAIMPGAADVRTFWENILRGFNAITEVPADRWDWKPYYDADPKAPDKIISKWGGFVPDIPFDPVSYGMPPTSLPSIEPVQLLLLEATRKAIEDAGYADRPFARERTAVVLGMGGGAAQLAMGYAFRSYLPMLDAVRPGAGTDALKACEGLLPEWTEDSFPGFLLNVAAGRVANRFDLGGANYTVDAACGSSLAAAALAVRELETGSADVVLLGGADTVQNPFTYLAFSKTQAFSPRGRCRPFDASADGIVISEGVAVLVLKRLADAERDGDRIYAVIKGLGASSDGRAKGLTAPSPEGQVRALKRAYAKSGVAPETIGYVEAHGTGTAVGDVVEVNAISGIYRESGVPAGSVAIGSVKSMIGHTKCAAGLAGLVNASLALHHRVLPPTIGVESINPKADLTDGPFRVNKVARPWVHGQPDRPRRAGVSAFGFGGTNFHAILESYDADASKDQAPVRDWPAELFAWRGPDRTKLIENLDRLLKPLEAGARPALRDLARAVSAANSPQTAPMPTLAIVATSIEDLMDKIRNARTAIASGEARIDGMAGFHYDETPKFVGQPVAFLFPGQGSQSPGMLADLAIAFHEVREAFDDFDSALIRTGRPPIGSLVFPGSPRNETERDRATLALRATDMAQPALGAASVGLLRLLRSLGLEADVLAGHSFGELVALHASNAISDESLAELAHERGRLMIAALGEQPGSMAAIAAGWDRVTELVDRLQSVVAVNENGPNQTVIAGPDVGIQGAIEAARRAGFRAEILPVGGAFHTPQMDGAVEALTLTASRLVDMVPDRPVYSNVDMLPHPNNLEEIAARVGGHVANPVRFASMVDSMYRDGARVFVEVGPGSTLSSLVGSILAGRPHLAVSFDAIGRPGISTFLDGLARLIIGGIPVELDRLFDGRSDRVLNLEELSIGDGSPSPSATAWLVNGSRARPIGRPEPRRLGQGPALAAPTPKAKLIETPHRNGTSSSYGDEHQVRAPSNGKPMEINQYRSQPPRPSPSPSGAANDQVMASFQETMRAFLDVQKSTMLAYLAGRSHPSASPPGAIVPSLLPEPLHARIKSRPPSNSPSPVEVVTSPPDYLEPGPSMSKGAGESKPITDLENISFDRDEVASKLVEIVCGRTGYPAEMLSAELDLEADLGIDSIKRVEILGTLRDSVLALNGSTDPTLMDTLSRARTLGAIVDRVDEFANRHRSRSVVATSSPARISTDSQTAGSTGSIRRMVLETVPAPLSTKGTGLLPGGVVLVTDDGRGIARSVGSLLELAGHSVILAGPEEVDFASPSSVEGLLDLARSSGDLVAIIHALPLRQLPTCGIDPSAWASRMGPEMRGLFLLAKAAAADLERASNRGGGALLAATAMGGDFALDSTCLDFFPGHGSIAGLVKTLAREWPEVRTRVVDMDARQEPGLLAARLVEEILSDDMWSEIGYFNDTRVRLRTKLAPLPTSSNPKIELSPGEAIIVTGGARGITATIAAELARRWKPTLLLLGRSPLPSMAEDRDLDRLTSIAEMKAILHSRLRRNGLPVTPGSLERAFQVACNAREIRNNLALFRSSGATVEYAEVDVRNAEALARILDGWRRKFGEPVGLIHGAGVIKDKLIRDKTPESFDHVLGTKLDGALNLARLLNPNSVRFAALFSSIAGRYGNLGQADYAAANEVLNKLALWLDRRWPGRVVSMNWGPWSGVGMVSDLEGHLGGQGLGIIPPEIGRTLFYDELRFGRKGEVELVVAGDLGTLDAPIGQVRRLEAAR